MVSTSNYVDTMALIARISMRQRTSDPKPFKAQIVKECLQPASVALRHGLNANLVRKWIPVYRDRQVMTLPAFVPLPGCEAGLSLIPRSPILLGCGACRRLSL